MKPSERGEYVKYRLEKAEEAFQAATLLVANSQWNAAINRLYYAAFYAVTGLLVQNNIETKSHSGVKTQFFMLFVKPGTIPLEMGKLYSDLFDWRQKGDYGDFFDFSEEDVLPLLQPTRNLLDSVRRVLSN